MKIALEKHTFRIFLWVIIMCALALPVTTAANSQNASHIDWQSFLHRNDMVWDQLPNGLTNAPFLGNGDLGTIFWQDADGSLRFEVSREDLYDHRRTSKSLSILQSNERLPNGHFSLSFGSTDPKPTGSMRLDLWNAEVDGELSSASASWHLRAFAPAKSDLIVVSVSGPANAMRPLLSWHPDIAMSPRLTDRPKNLNPYPPQVEEDFRGIHVSVQEMPEDSKYQTDGRGVGQYATAWTSFETGTGQTIYLFSTQISYPGRSAALDAADELLRAKAQGMELLEKQHRAWWHAFYPKSFLSVPDASMESFYWIQMYKMGSIARQNGPIIDLLGPWFSQTNWPAIWWNLNIELTYWPFYESNHLEEADSLNREIWKHRPSLAANAAPFQSDSFAIGRASGPTLESPVGNEIGNLPWAMQDLWFYYRSSMNDKYLREQLFPLMKGSFNYLWHISTVHPDGSITLPPSASPEYINQVENSSYSSACFRWLARTIIEADSRLKTHDPVVAEAKRVLTSLAPYSIDPASGLMVGKDVPFVKSHRHWSHLFMIYPFDEWSRSDPEKRSLMDHSIDNWVDKPKDWTGFSYLGAASLFAQEGDGDKSLGYLKSFLQKWPQPNTLYHESWPVIETPLASARTLQELLMTSQDGGIRVFPAVPTSWSDVAFAGMRAEGAFLVTAVRHQGVTQFVTVTSLAGERCLVYPGLNGPIKAIGKRRFKLIDMGGGEVEINLAKGETVTLYAGDRIPNTTVSPVPRTGEFQPWGESRGEQR
jgi:alpha-L-fucosidase 2